jgi:ribosomal protein RSM22 (predicted rRNA methylase)
MPHSWEALLKGYVKRTFYADTRRKDFAGRPEFTEGDYRFFVKGIRDLSVAFTQERASLPKNYLTRKEMRSGYILYFLPVNALKVATLLGSIPADRIVRDDRIDLAILDVGSGPGTGMLGTMLFLERHLSRAKSVRLRWTFIDQNRQALQDAAALHDLALSDLRKRLPKVDLSSEVRLEGRDLFQGRISRSVSAADLILCLNVLSEIVPNRRRPLLEDLLTKVLAPTGRLLAMEPALQSTTRDLMELHDEILDRSLAFVHAPCLHQAECPMLKANERDWCHTYVPWERPPWIEKFDRLAAIRKEYLKCSYLLLSQEHPPSREADLWRVVSGPLNSKGKSERLLCGEAGLPGLLRACRLDRDGSPANADFDALERGDLVRMAKTGRVTKETPLRKI